MPSDAAHTARVVPSSGQRREQEKLRIIERAVVLTGGAFCNPKQGKNLCGAAIVMGLGGRISSYPDTWVLPRTTPRLPILSSSTSSSLLGNPSQPRTLLSQRTTRLGGTSILSANHEAMLGKERNAGHTRCLKDGKELGIVSAFASFI